MSPVQRFRTSATAALALAGTLALFGAGTAQAADPHVAPGGNFDLSVWELQEPVGSPGHPTTIPSSRLQGPNGYQDDYFYTDTRDGAMTFWAPEKGVTTPNSKYARSELREMNRDGSAADWSLSGNHRLSATLRVVSVTSNVCVGQIHLGSGGTSADVLVVPGGDGAFDAMLDPAVVAFVRREAERATWVTSVCTGAFVIGAAGLLAGKRATTHWASKPMLAAFGAQPVDEIGIGEEGATKAEQVGIAFR